MPVRGARVLRTEVRCDGEFRLRYLNAPITRPDLARPAFLRRFWDGLLVRGSARSSSLHENVPIREPQRQHFWGELTDIERRARAALADLHREIERGNGGAALAQSVARLSAWQDDLRRFVDKHSTESSLARFLLVRASTMRTDNLQEYVEDVETTLTLFRKAVSWTSPAIRCETLPHEHASTL